MFLSLLTLFLVRAAAMPSRGCRLRKERHILSSFFFPLSFLCRLASQNTEITIQYSIHHTSNNNKQQQWQ